MHKCILKIATPALVIRFYLGLTRAVVVLFNSIYLGLTRADVVMYECAWAAATLWWYSN